MPTQTADSQRDPSHVIPELACSVMESQFSLALRGIVHWKMSGLPRALRNLEETLLYSMNALAQARGRQIYWLGYWCRVWKR